MDNNKVNKKLILTGFRGCVGSAIYDYFVKFFPEIEIIKFPYPDSLQKLHDVIYKLRGI